MTTDGDQLAYRGSREIYDARYVNFIEQERVRDVYRSCVNRTGIASRQIERGDLRRRQFHRFGYRAVMQHDREWHTHLRQIEAANYLSIQDSNSLRIDLLDGIGIDAHPADQRSANFALRTHREALAGSFEESFGFELGPPAAYLERPTFFTSASSKSASSARVRFGKMVAASVTSLLFAPAFFGRNCGSDAAECVAPSTRPTIRTRASSSLLKK